MSVGIVVLFFVFIWLLVVLFLSSVITTLVDPKPKQRRLLYVVSFVSLVLISFGDEFLDQYQIGDMCKQENLLIFEPDQVKGKSVKYESSPAIKIETPVTASIGFTKWVDVSTNELLITKKSIVVEGGWLSRWIGFNSSAPITYSGDCLSKEYRKMFAKYGITIID